jgi:NAD+ synthase (glutamine-hydrolysing)
MATLIEPTKKGGGIYLYANLKGCDGQRYVFDGCPTCVLNGEIYA